MANIQNVGFINPDTQEVEHRRRLAEALQGQALQPQQSQTAGGYVVPYSPAEGIMKLAQAYLARKSMQGADEASRELYGRQQNRRSADMSLFAQALRGRPAQQERLEEDVAGNVNQVPSSPAMQPMETMGQALPLMGPEMQPIALQAMMEENKPYNLGQGEVRFRGQQPIAAGLPKPQQPTAPVPIVGPQGRPVYASREQALGQEVPQKDPLVNVDMKGEGEYAKKVGGLSGERDVTQHDTASAAVENIHKLNLTLNQITHSQAITGLGAEVLKNIERAKVLVMRDEAAGKKASDTELLDALLGSDVFPMIKQLGIGARGLDTPAEREFLRDVMTGQTPLNRETLKRMTEMRRDIAVRAVERWNERVGSGELDRYFHAAGMPKKKIQIPKLEIRPQIPQNPQGGWSEEKERRYQELLRRQNATQ